MNIDPMVLYDYTTSSTDRVIEGARALPEVLLIEPIRPGYLSFLGLLGHMMSSEQVWLTRWQGAHPNYEALETKVDDLDSALTTWQPIRTAMREFLSKLTTQDRIITYRTTQGVEYHQVLSHLIMHVINHSTEHRAQLAFYLAMHEIDVGALDFVWYLRAKG